MAECFDRDENFHALVRAMRRPQPPLALLGAGTSVDSGYPDWNELLKILDEKAKGLIGHKYESFLGEQNDPAWQAEEYLQILGEEAFCEVVKSVFAPREKIGEALQIISQLGFRHILTTNYDPCIDVAFRERKPLRVVDWGNEAELRQFFLDLSADPEQSYVLHLHGRYDNPAGIILTESSYAARYMRSDDARNKLFAIFLTQPVVFIGFSVTDPDLNHLMREVNARLGAGQPQHFALIGYKVPQQRERIRGRFLGKYGIAPVFYQITGTDEPGGESHRCLVDLLAALHEHVRGGPPEIRRPAQPPEDVVPREATGPVLNPLDEQKGRWGGQAERNGRVLSVRDVVEKVPGQVLTFNLVVESTPDAEELEGEVVFHLHQTFHPKVYSVPARGGHAVLDITSAYGAFTVGVQADGGATTLELDLALAPHPDLPDWFRER